MSAGHDRDGLGDAMPCPRAAPPRRSPSTTTAGTGSTSAATTTSAWPATRGSSRPPRTPSASYGTSTSGSRVLNGTTRLHLQLEEELADHYGTEAAVLTSSGMNANLGAAVDRRQPGRRPARRRARARQRARRRRRQPGHREPLPAQRRRLSWRQRLERLDPRAGAVVVVDGVYSMTGETRPAGRDRRAVRHRRRAGSCVDERRTGSACSRRGTGAGRRADRRARPGGRRSPWPSASRWPASGAR